MSRKNEFAKAKNPSVKFIGWKSEKKTLTYYDKEKKKEIAIVLPFEFVILKEMHTVRGYQDSSNSQIFANQVEFTSSQELNVQSREGGNIAKGLYQDIKDRVKESGGKYVKVLHIMEKDGTISTIHLKGSAVKVYGDFTSNNRTQIVDKFISVTGANDEKKGKVSYTTPIFELGNEISEKDDKIAENCYDTVQAYIGSLNIKEVQGDSQVTE
jgi:hypothetical protein